MNNAKFPFCPDITLNFIVPAFSYIKCRSSTCIISSPSGSFRIASISSLYVPTNFFSSYTSTRPYFICFGAKNYITVSCQDTDCYFVSFFFCVYSTYSPIVTLTDTFISPKTRVFLRRVQFSNLKHNFSNPPSLKIAFKFIKPMGLFLCSMMTLIWCSTPGLLSRPSKSTIP